MFSVPVASQGCKWTLRLCSIKGRLFFFSLQKVTAVQSRAYQWLLCPQQMQKFGPKMMMCDKANIKRSRLSLLLSSSLSLCPSHVPSICFCCRKCKAEFLIQDLCAFVKAQRLPGTTQVLFTWERGKSSSAL